MTVTIVGIVYDVNNLKRKRTIISDDCDEHVHAHQNILFEGEKFMTIPIEVYNTFTEPQHVDVYIASVIGMPIQAGNG